MKIRLSCCALFFAFSACLVPTRDTQLGDVDGGTTDAGITDGGANDAGTDAGMGLSDGGPLVPELSALPEAACHALTVAGTCASDAGPCLLEHRQSHAPHELANFSSSLFVVQGSAGHGGVLYGTSSDGANPDRVWFTPSQTSLAGWFISGDGSPVLLKSLPGGTTLHGLTDFASFGTGFWFIARTSSSAGERYEVIRADDFTASVTTVATLTAQPTSTLVATDDGNAYLGTTDGLTRYTTAGWSMLAPPQPNHTIRGVDSDGSSVWTLECDSTNCGIWTFLLSASTQTKLASLPLIEEQLSMNARPMVSARGALYVLSASEVVQVDVSTGTTSQLYAGQPFPQFTGTLKRGSLRTDGAQLFFGNVCHFDADDPQYGSVAIDLATRTARWLELDANAPHVPYTAGYRASESDNLVHDGTTLYLLH